jgi:glyoxylase-like metal-dependent hydrolase (beta-lactamase superfamily II)
VPVIPVKLAENVWRIPTLGNDLINSFAFVDSDGSVCLVDAGLKGASRKLLAALGAIGKSATDVSNILLTHAHFDHVGGAARLRDATGASVQLHDDDAGYLREGKAPPFGQKGLLARVMAMASPGLPACHVDATFCEGDLLPIAGGIRVLHTPGHTPGHASFLHEPSGVLITGDALFNFRDRISYSFAMFCSDSVLSRETADRLGEVDYEVAAFTHGPEMRDRPREAIREFLLRRQSR